MIRIASLQLLPSSLISKIMSEVLTGDVKVDGAVKDYIQDAVASFILHLTGEACNKCDREGRKSLTGDDILWSVDRLGFRDYEAPLRTFLRRHRAIESEERMRKRGQAMPSDVDAARAVSTGPQPLAAIVVNAGRGSGRPAGRR